MTPPCPPPLPPPLRPPPPHLAPSPAKNKTGSCLVSDSGRESAGDTARERLRQCNNDAD